MNVTNATQSSLGNGTSPERPPAPTNQIAVGILLYGLPTFACIGVVGNVLSFVVALTKSMRGTSYSVYIAALAVTDTLNLFHFMTRNYFQNALGLSAQWMLNNCYVTRWFTSGSQTAGAWIVITMTTHRFLAIYRPLDCRRWFTLSCSVITVCSVVLLPYVLYIPALLTFNSGPCMGRRGPPGFVSWPLYVDSVYPAMNAITYSLAPSILLVFLNTAIFVRLMMRARRAKQTTSRSASSNKPREIVVVVIIVSVLYVCLTTPSVIFLLYLSQTGRSIAKHTLRYTVGAVGILLVIANHSINIFVYMGSSVFRSALMPCRWRTVQREQRSGSAAQPQATGSTSDMSLDRI